MSKSIFITATGTDIGKTYVTGLLLKKLIDAGLNATYFKAAVSGNVMGESGLIPGDAAYVNKIANIQGDLKEMVPYVYKNAVSPHLASRIEGNPVDMNVVNAYYDHMRQKYDYVVVEGSGGILCPICFDERKIWLEDVIKDLNLDCILIANAGLGTINDVGLTVSYMKYKGIALKGIILNRFHPGDLMEEDNRDMITYMTKIPVLATVKDGDMELEIDVDKLIELFR